MYFEKGSANFRFAHFNFMLDLEKSLKFYKEALGLEPVRKDAQDGSFTGISWR